MGIKVCFLRAVALRKASLEFEKSGSGSIKCNGSVRFGSVRFEYCASTENLGSSSIRVRNFDGCNFSSAAVRTFNAKIVSESCSICE